MSASRPAVLKLYKSMLGNAAKFANYNFREHAKRRIVGEFKISKQLTGAEANAKYVWGLDQAEMVRRQSIVSQLYPEESSVAAQRTRTRL